MALKDWEKIESQYHSYLWKHRLTGQTISIISPLNKPHWFIEISGEYGYIVMKKTRREALKFAKNYMRED